LPGPPEDAPEVFKLGYEDGCHTGLAAHGNSTYRTFYDYKKNPQYALDPVYNKGWKDAENYCRTYAHYSTVKGGGFPMEINISGLDNLWSQDAPTTPFWRSPGDFGAFATPGKSGDVWQQSGYEILGNPSPNQVWGF